MEKPQTQKNNKSSSGSESDSPVKQKKQPDTSSSSSSEDESKVLNAKKQQTQNESGKGLPPKKQAPKAKSESDSDSSNEELPKKEELKPKIASPKSSSELDSDEDMGKKNKNQPEIKTGKTENKEDKKNEVKANPGDFEDSDQEAQNATMEFVRPGKEKKGTEIKKEPEVKNEKKSQNSNKKPLNPEEDNKKLKQEAAAEAKKLESQKKLIKEDNSSSESEQDKKKQVVPEVKKPEIQKKQLIRENSSDDSGEEDNKMKPKKVEHNSTSSSGTSGEENKKLKQAGVAEVKKQESEKKPIKQEAANVKKQESSKMFANAKNQETEQKPANKDQGSSDQSSEEDIKKLKPKENEQKKHTTSSDDSSEEDHKKSKQQQTKTVVAQMYPKKNENPKESNDKGKISGKQQIDEKTKQTSQKKPHQEKKQNDGKDDSGMSDSSNEKNKNTICKADQNKVKNDPQINIIKEDLTKKNLFETSQKKNFGKDKSFEDSDKETQKIPDPTTKIVTYKSNDVNLKSSNDQPKNTEKIQSQTCFEKQTQSPLEKKTSERKQYEERKSQNNEDKKPMNVHKNDTKPPNKKEAFTKNQKIIEDDEEESPSQKTKLTQKSKDDNEENSPFNPSKTLEVLRPAKTVQKKPQEESKTKNSTNNKNEQVLGDENMLEVEKTVKEDEKLCFGSDIDKIPKIIKRVLAEKKIKGGDWGIFKRLNSHLEKLYGIFEKPVGKETKIDELLPEIEACLGKNVKKELKAYSHYREIKKDGNSLYRSMGFLYLEQLFLSFGTFNNLETKPIFKLIESFDVNHRSYLEFFKVKGYNLDSVLTKTLENTEFLQDILRRFLCLFVHKNFQFKKKPQESQKTQKKLFHKRKVLNFIAKSLSEYPILDVALIVYMRTLLSSKLTEDQKKGLGVKIFGKEPCHKSLKIFGEKLDVNVTLFNLDLKEPAVEEYKEETKNLDFTLLLKDGNYCIAYQEEVVKELYGK